MTSMLVDCNMKRGMEIMGWGGVIYQNCLIEEEKIYKEKIDNLTQPESIGDPNSPTSNSTLFRWDL